MELKAGSRWKSAVCETEVVVVRAPSAPASLTCGGQEMVPHGATPPAGLVIAEDAKGGTLVGKRYTDADTGIEILCTKSGAGSLALDGRPVPVKDAKKLPSSD